MSLAPGRRPMRNTERQGVLHPGRVQAYVCGKGRRANIGTRPRRAWGFGPGRSLSFAHILTISGDFTATDKRGEDLAR